MVKKWKHRASLLFRFIAASVGLIAIPAHYCLLWFFQEGGRSKKSGGPKSQQQSLRAASLIEQDID
eukprot:716283-Ditylum_brightwellii.AAC.1